jgi:hypothetical protein
VWKIRLAELNPAVRTYRLMIDRDDTPEWDPVVLEDTITCSPNTPTGSDMAVPLNGGTEVMAGMGVTFYNITTGGTTNVLTSTEGPPPPTGFEIVGLAEVPLYFDINTDASYSGGMTACVRYDQTRVQRPEAALRLMQRIDNDYVEVTTAVDTTSDIICGATTQLSVFVVVQPLAAVGGIVELLQSSAPPAQQPGLASPPFASPRAARPQSPSPSPLVRGTPGGGELGRAP